VLFLLAVLFVLSSLASFVVRSSSVSVVTSLLARWPEFHFRQGIIFILSRMCRPALWPSQPSVRWVTGVLSSGVKRSERYANYSHPCSAEDMNALNCTSTTSYVCMAWCLPGTTLPLLYNTCYGWCIFKTPGSSVKCLAYSFLWMEWRAVPIFMM
jgi:hypothetical protein